MDNCSLVQLCMQVQSKFHLFYVQCIIFTTALAFGALLMLRPKKVIEIQMAVYRPFNWKLEPISMEKEVKSTRIMGIVLGVFSVISAVSIYLFRFVL